MKYNYFSYRITFLFFIVLTSCEKNIDVSDEHVARYVNENKKELKNDNWNELLGLITPDDLEKKVILIGEHHGTLMNKTIYLNIFKSLRKIKKVDNLFMEIGFAQSELLNEYLRTGNEEILNLIMNQSKGSFSFTVESKTFYQELKKYYDDLPSDQKFKVIGADVEHQPALALAYVHTISKTGQDPIMKEISNLRTYNNNSKIDRESVKSILTKIETNWSEAFKNENFGLIFTLRNMINASDFYISGKQQIREEAIIENAFQLIKRDNNASYFGQWGALHVLKRNKVLSVINQKTMAKSLQHDKNSPVKGNVISINMFYSQSFYRDQDGSSKPLDDFSYRPVLNNCNSEVTLIKLNRTESPFSQCKLFPFYSTTGGVTTDYFDYMIIVKNSKSMTRLN